MESQSIKKSKVVPGPAVSVDSTSAPFIQFPISGEINNSLDNSVDFTINNDINLNIDVTGADGKSIHQESEGAPGPAVSVDSTDTSPVRLLISGGINNLLDNSIDFKVNKKSNKKDNKKDNTETLLIESDSQLRPAALVGLLFHINPLFDKHSCMKPLGKPY